MLTQVPNAQRIAARAMVTRHPNAFECQVWRKVVLRAEGGDTVGGLPTLGGMGTTDAEDEPNFTYELLGDGFCLFTGTYPGTTLTDRRDSAEPQTGEALIEPEEVDAWAPKDGDLVALMPGGGVVVTYEVTKVLNVTLIPPYVARYELSPQGDLTFIDALDRP